MITIEKDLFHIITGQHKGTELHGKMKQSMRQEQVNNGPQGKVHQWVTWNEHNELVGIVLHVDVQLRYVRLQCDPAEEGEQAEVAHPQRGERGS